MARLRIIGRNGDSHVSWEIDDKAAVAEAKRIFAEHRDRGYYAVVVAPHRPEHGTALKSFDPTIEQVVLIPPLVGG